MSDNLLTRSDGGIQALYSLDFPCLARLLGCLPAMLAPRVEKMGNICPPSPLAVTPRGGRAFQNTIQIQCVIRVLKNVRRVLQIDHHSLAANS